MRTAFVLVIALVSSVGLTGRAAAAVPIAPSFQPFELFFTTNNPPFTNVQCDQDGGSSSFEYSASGEATGPYAGTFHETGKVTIGPQSNPGPSGIPVFSGETTSWTASFEIDSPAGTVRGTKWLVSGPNNLFARCVNGPPITAAGNDDQVAGGNLRYAVVIKTAEGLFWDAGVASANVSQCNCFGPSGTISRFASFISVFRSDYLTAQRGLHGLSPRGD